LAPVCTLAGGHLPLYLRRVDGNVVGKGFAKVGAGVCVGASVHVCCCRHSFKWWRKWGNRLSSKGVCVYVCMCVCVCVCVGGCREMAVSFSRCAEFGKGFVVVVVRQKFLRKKKEKNKKETTCNCFVQQELFASCTFTCCWSANGCLVKKGVRYRATAPCRQAVGC